MLRSELESWMKERGMKSITIVTGDRDKGKDTIGIDCTLKGGFLSDYTDHRVNRRLNIVGYIDYSGETINLVYFDGRILPLMDRKGNRL